MTVRAIAVAVALALAVLAGCKKEPATCSQLAPVIVAWGQAEIAEQRLTGDDAAERTKLFAMSAELYPRVCAQGRWSSDTIACLVAARTEADAQTCGLTKDQGEALQKALTDALIADHPKGGS